MNNEPEERIDEVDAKGGKRVKGMPIVLALSTGVAIVVLLLIFGGFAA